MPLAPNQDFERILNLIHDLSPRLDELPPAQQEPFRRLIEVVLPVLDSARPGEPGQLPGGSTAPEMFPPVAIPSQQAFFTSPVQSAGVQLPDTVHDAIIITDPAFRVVVWNRAAELLYGWSRTEAIGQRIDRLILPTEPAGTQEAFLDELRTQGSYQGEWRQAHRNGSPLRVDSTVVAIKDCGGQLSGYALTCRDLTSIRQAEERVARILASITDCYLAVDPDGQITEINDSALEFLGLPRQVLAGRPLLEAIPAASPIFRETYRRVMVSGQPLRFEECPLTGDRWAEMHFYPGPDGLEVYFRDITARKRYEAALRQANERLTRVLSSMAEAYFTLDSGWRFVDVNPLAAQIVFHRTVEELLGGVIWETFPEGLGSIFYLQYEKAFREQRPVHFEGRSTLGTHWFEVHAYPRQGLLEVYAHDITERHLIEEALRESQARFELSLRDSPITVFSMDAWLRYTWIHNPLAGYTASQMIGHTDADLFPPEAVGELIAAKRQALGRGVGIEREITVQLNGETYYLEAKIEPLRDAEGMVVGLTGVLIDLTERRRAEAEARAAASRLEVQRLLARHREMERAQIARDLHDGPIQELYGIIFMASSAAETAPEGPVRLELAAIQEAVRAQIDSLRAFCSELRPPALAHFGLEEAIRSHAETFVEKYPELEVSLELSSEAEILPEEVLMTCFRIYQEALNNVARHARATQVHIRLQDRPDRLELEIGDNGVGFEPPAEWVDLARQGHLGVVGMRERAESIGGTLVLESAPGQGSLIRLSVPVEEQG